MIISKRKFITVMKPIRPDIDENADNSKQPPYRQKQTSDLFPLITMSEGRPFNFELLRLFVYSRDGGWTPYN
jgi:hypothetical protein